MATWQLLSDVLSHIFQLSGSARDRVECIFDLNSPLCSDSVAAKCDAALLQGAYTSDVYLASLPL